METHVKVKIELDGSKKLTTLSHLTIVQRHDWHHTFELRLPLEDVEGKDGSGKAKTTFDTSKGFVGKPIKVGIEAVAKDGAQGEQFNQFNGIITDMSISRHGGTAADVIFRGYSPTILLDDGENTKAFTEKTVSQIVAEVTKGYSNSQLNIKVKVSPDTKYPYAIQYRETNYAYLSRIASENGKWFYYDGKDVYFGKMTAGPKMTMKLGNDISNFDLGLHVKPLKFSDSAYDFVNNNVIEVASGSITVSGLDASGSDMVNKSQSLFGKEVMGLPNGAYKNQSELKDSSTTKKSAIASNLVTISGTSFNPKLIIGSQIEIQSNDLETSATNYGTYIVISVSHYTDSLGVYQNNFQAVASTITIPPANPHVAAPVCETQPAKVVKNDDPDGMGRIKVRFYWQKDQDTTPWIRVVNHHAGKSKGFQFLPEVDDEVLISFEQNNPDRPYMVGALYHGKAKHDDRKDKDNYIKTIRTVSGNEVQFNDKKGEEQIIIRNKESQNEIILSLKDDGKITIKGKNKIEIKGKEILIEAEEKLTMKSDESHLSGKSKLTLDSEQKGEIKTNELNIETQTKLSMKAGTQAELKATAGLDIDGGPKMSVKSSGMMELNGGGQATLKAGIVMIN